GDEPAQPEPPERVIVPADVAVAGRFDRTREVLVRLAGTRRRRAPARELDDRADPGPPRLEPVVGDQRQIHRPPQTAPVPQQLAVPDEIDAADERELQIVQLLARVSSVP